MPRATYRYPDSFDQGAFEQMPGAERWEYFLDNDSVRRVRKVRWMYNANGGALLAGGVYAIYYGGASATPTTIPMVKTVVAAPATTYEEVCVAIKATADATYDWFVVEGFAEARCTDAAALADLNQGDYLKIDVSDDADAFQEDTTTRTVASLAVYMDGTAKTGGTVSDALCWLIGRGAVTPA